MSPMRVQSSGSWAVDEAVDGIVVAAVDGRSTRSSVSGQSSSRATHGREVPCGTAGGYAQMRFSVGEASAQVGHAPAAGAPGQRIPSSGHGLRGGLPSATTDRGAASGVDAPAADDALGATGSLAGRTEGSGSGESGGGGSGGSSRGSVEGGLEETLQELLCDVVGTFGSANGSGSPYSSGDHGVRELGGGGSAHDELPSAFTYGMREVQGGGTVAGDMHNGSVVATDLSCAPGSGADAGGPLVAAGVGAADSVAVARDCAQRDGGDAAGDRCVHVARGTGGDAGLALYPDRSCVQPVARGCGNPHGDGGCDVAATLLAGDAAGRALCADAGQSTAKVRRGQPGGVESVGAGGGSGAARCAQGVAVVRGRWEHASGAQRFFQGHDDDVLCVAMHPNGELAATGQVRRHPTASARCVSARYGCVRSRGEVGAVQ